MGEGSSWLRKEISVFGDFGSWRQPLGEFGSQGKALAGVARRRAAKPRQAEGGGGDGPLYWLL